MAAPTSTDERLALIAKSTSGFLYLISRTGVTGTKDQLADECLKINDLLLGIYKDFGFENIVIKLSLRPEKRVGSDALWDKAEKASP